MTIDIRMARAEDAAVACDVLRRSIAECCTEDHRNEPAVLDAWLGNKTPANVQCWLSSPAHVALVAERKGQVCGVAVAQRTGKIVLFYVAPEARQAGAGTALLAALEAHAAKSGLRQLQVASTLTARGFYLRHGFAESGRVPAPFGIDAICMSKTIDAGYPRKGFCRCGGS